MCIRQTWNWIDVSGTSYPRTNTVITCSPPCRRPQVVRLPDEYHVPATRAPAIMVPQGNQRERVYIRREQPRREERNDLRLEWRWHIPFTRKKEKKYVVIEEPAPAPIFIHHAPPTPPLTPRRVIEANVVPISPRSPRLPVREHQTRLIAPARERSQERLERQRREEARRLAARRAALEAHIEGLRQQQSAREAEREEARRSRAHEMRIRQIDADIARLREELQSSERRHRRAQGNILHQADPPHRQDFRIHHQDAGGGVGNRDGGDGLGGGRHARQRAQDREIRDLERRFAEERRRRRREALAADPNTGRRQENPFRQPRNNAAGVWINNRNGRARM